MEKHKENPFNMNVVLRMFMFAGMVLTLLLILYFGGYGVGTLLIEDDGNMFVRWLVKPVVGVMVLLMCFSWSALILTLLPGVCIMCVRMMTCTNTNYVQIA